MRTLLSRIILSLGLAFGFGGAALADVISFDLTTGNPAISGFPGSYATVSINRTDATHATITFTALTQGSIQYFLGGQGAAGVNISGTFALGSMSCSGGGGVCGALSAGGAGTEDGWGKFNLTIDSFDGFTHRASQIVFDISATGTTTWADASSVLTANAGGSKAAAHIFVIDPNPPCTTGTTAACATGYAAGSGGGGPPVIIPEPQTLALLGLGLLVLGIARRRQVG